MIKVIIAVLLLVTTQTQAAGAIKPATELSIFARCAAWATIGKLPKKAELFKAAYYTLDKSEFRVSLYAYRFGLGDGSLLGSGKSAITYYNSVCIMLEQRAKFVIAQSRV